MRSSRCLKVFIRWRNYSDGRLGLYPHPPWLYDLWARVFGFENRVVHVAKRIGRSL